MPMPPKPADEKLSESLTVLFSKPMRAALQRMADKQGVSAGEFVRRLVGKAMRDTH